MGSRLLLVHEWPLSDLGSGCVWLGSGRTGRLLRDWVVGHVPESYGVHVICFLVLHNATAVNKREMSVSRIGWIGFII